MNKHIDSKLIPVLKELNKIGLKTIASCEGHDITGFGYISFDINCINMTWITKKAVTIYFDPIGCGKQSQ